MISNKQIKLLNFFTLLILIILIINLKIKIINKNNIIRLTRTIISIINNYFNLLLFVNYFIFEQRNKNKFINSQNYN